jgi:hypothetical protein
MLGKEIDIWSSGDAMRNTVSLLFYLELSQENSLTEVPLVVWVT